MITVIILGIEKETTFNILTNLLNRERYDQREEYAYHLSSSKQPQRGIINEITNFLKIIMIRIMFNMTMKSK